MGKLGRRAFLAAAGVATTAGIGGLWLTRKADVPLGFSVSPSELDEAHAFLSEFPAIDAHAHPGRTFAVGAENLPVKIELMKWLMAGKENGPLDAMRKGGMSAAVFAGVSDFQTLDLVKGAPANVRDFNRGEAWSSYRRQIGNLQALAKRGLVRPILEVGDFQRAKADGKVGAIWAMEGGDFLEGKAERVALAYADGLRSITLLHYRNNEIGDIATGEPRSGGLTAAGEAIVAACNDAGILIDVAHASERTAYGIVEATRLPVMASHVHVNSHKFQHPRFISSELGRMIADHGGGILGAWPAGLGITTLDGFVGRTKELMALVGTDHVCFGSDIDANYRPVFDDYSLMPHYVARLFQTGVRPDDVAKVVGGNFKRIFGAVAAGKQPAATTNR